MKSTRRFLTRVLLGGAAALGLATLSAAGAFAQGSPAAPALEQDEAQDASPAGPGGAVFAMTNETAGNRIVAYRRALDGTLTRVHSVRTRGLGGRRRYRYPGAIAPEQ